MRKTRLSRFERAAVRAGVAIGMAYGGETAIRAGVRAIEGLSIFRRLEARRQGVVRQQVGKLVRKGLDLPVQLTDGGGPRRLQRDGRRCTELRAATDPTD